MRNWKVGFEIEPRAANSLPFTWAYLHRPRVFGRVRKQFFRGGRYTFSEAQIFHFVHDEYVAANESSSVD